MPTNLHIDDRLIEHARRIGKHRTKREAVNAALEAYVRHLEQMKILELEGTVDFDPAWDYKAERRRDTDRMLRRRAR
ncbi:MAG TPA: type II toxin-antitoxin system VapB family antitoxin [Planctomycetota bacterium]|nr:type II toxin-antitoxin system VapB family antitoxin [Planctomycetota bacterium]